MKVAIIGAGFAGLATAYYLQASGLAKVTIFEEKGVGAGASGVCSGLLHPYVGLAVRRSHRAEEAIGVTKELLKVAEKHTPKIVSAHSGILRQSLNADQAKRLNEHCEKWGDVEKIRDDLFFIHSGVTVHSENYLEGLFAAITKLGGELLIQKIGALDDLSKYDHVVIAAGFGIAQFPECAHLKVKFLKGQALQMEGRPPHDRSFISKGYIAHLNSGSKFDLGSTYEKVFSHGAPDLPFTRESLKDKLLTCPDAKIIGCRAAVRVCPLGDYLPILAEVAPKAHVFTGLGSRGLLYHGLFGRKLASSILSKNTLIA